MRDVIPGWNVSVPLVGAIIRAGDRCRIGGGVLDHHGFADRLRKRDGEDCLGFCSETEDLRIGCAITYTSPSGPNSSRYGLSIPPAPAAT